MNVSAVVKQVHSAFLYLIGNTPSTILYEGETYPILVQSISHKGLDTNSSVIDDEVMLFNVETELLSGYTFTYEGNDYTVEECLGLKAGNTEVLWRVLARRSE